MEAPRPRTPARDTGLPPGVVVGGLPRRVVAYLIDSIVPGGAAVLIAGVAPGLSGGGAVTLTVAAVAASVAWALLCWWRLAKGAATPGMAVMKLQLVGFLDGRPIGWTRVLVRWLVFSLLGVTGIGLIALVAFLLLHPRRQGWHDRAATAVVIVERPLAPPRSRPAGSRPSAVEPPARTQQELRPEPRPDGGQESGASDQPAPAGSTRTGPHPARSGSSVPGSNGADSTGAGSAGVDSTGAGSDGAGSGGAGSDGAGSDGRRSILQGWAVELDDGREIDLEGLVLIGRNPQPGPGEEDARLVKLADESRTVSKTHLALGVDDAGPFVVDRGSTNGSTMSIPDRPSRVCAPHVAVSVEEGALVSIGDHWLRIRREQQ